MRWTPLTTRALAGVGVTSLLVTGAAVGAQAGLRPAATSGAAATASAPAAPAAAGPAAAADGSAAAGTARKHTPTAALAGLGRLRTGPAGRTIVTVKFRKGVKASSATGASALASTARGHGATKRSVAAGAGAATYTVPNADVDAFLAAMAARPEVAAATRAHLFAPLVTPTDTDFATQQKTYLTSIAAPTGWDYGLGSASVKIAVVDTGVDVGHPDLVGKVVDQYDTVTDTTDVTDGVGHGTFVAGVAAAATNNAKGIAGVGFNSSIVAVKVADADGFMSDVDVAEGIRKAADLGAKVINLSLGSSSSDTATSSAVAYAQSQGALVVAAAGNSGQEGNPKFYPAAYPGVLSVGATDAKGHRAWFSEHGTWVSMAAPGINIRATTPRVLDPVLSIWAKPNYDNGNGTSFAAPMVAGAAALLAARAPGATAAQIKAALVSTAHGYTPSYGLGKGQLDVAKAMAAIVPTTTPTISFPADGATVTDSTSFKATVGQAKAKIAWYVDGVRVGIVTSNTELIWMTAGWTDGPHTVQARGCSATGVCAATGPSISVTSVTTPPVLAKPLEGATVNGWTSSLIQGGVSNVYAVYVDGTRLLVSGGPAGPTTDTTPTNTPELNLSALAPGSHTIEVANCDATGTRCASPRSAPVHVTSTAIKPVAGAVTNPAFSPNGDGVKDTTTIRYTVPSIKTGTISFVDPDGNRTVRAVALGTKAAGTYTYTWNGKATDGTIGPMRNFLVRITATDATGVRGLAVTRTRLDVVAPTPTVQAGTLTTFYPVVDTYKDTFPVRFSLSEKATVTLTVKNAAGTTVRSISAAKTGVGIESLVWNGRNAAGALLPAGTYTWRLTSTDAAGMKRVSVAKKIVLSKKKLTTFTKVVSKGGTSAYAIGAGAACVTSTHTGSTYAAGLWLKNNCPKTNPQIAAAFYHLTVPAAVSYTSFKVTTSGRSHSQPAEVIAGIYGTQIDDYDLTYPSKKVTVATTQTLTMGTITGPGHAPGKVVDLVVFVPNDVYGPLTDWDVQTAKVTVTYRALA
ncbi:S8 family serine peptidase [Kineosporia sp. A_224]|uniref:S8 family serine peptidase n=1 Tax=Kineosporia sp. A_224 TaxID=1962180 RepID=UPI000B4AD965|nr:S8 family serine peptidase [Kineosporia sp. A_224]